MDKRNDTLVYGVSGALEFLEALSDKTRQRILAIFVRLPECRVTEIAARFELSRPTISHHLSVLRKARVLVSRREGTEVYYSFNKDYVVGTLEKIRKRLEGYR